MYKKENIETIINFIIKLIPIDWAKKVYITDIESSTYNGETSHSISIEFILDDNSEFLNINNMSLLDRKKSDFIKSLINKVQRVITDDIYVSSNSVSSESYYNSRKNGR